MSRKTCTKCHLEKSSADFNFRNKEKEIRHSYCRECGKNYTRSHYKRRKSLYIKRNKKTQAEKREIVLQAKTKPCHDCGIQYPYYVMDFDHRIAAEKKFSLHRFFSYTKKQILEEIAKCDVVCANCHRERTYQRLQKKRNMSDKI